MLQSRSTKDKIEFWKHSKQLEHGSLIALWYELNTPATLLAAHRARREQQQRAAATAELAAPVDPELIFATIVDRDARKLAGLSVRGSTGDGAGSISSSNGSNGSSKGEGGVRCRIGIR